MQAIRSDPKNSCATGAVHIWVPAFRRDDKRGYHLHVSNSLPCCPCCRHDLAISPPVLREVCKNIPPSEPQRARGTPGARCARSRACSVVNTRVSHHGHTGITRHSPRNGFNGLFRALPGDRACLPPSSLRSLLLKNLTPASGRQDHTTSPSA